jgi:5-oxoprolinase (ATP-hydrolysing)
VVAQPGQAIIGFDMGGTSTDVSRCSDVGQYEHVHETTTAGITIQAPQLDIATVAAGGGSRLFFQNGLFVVGPESVGANPGPVSYRKGGNLAITDANLVLGRIVVDAFPKIFGPNEDESLDREAAQFAFQQLTDLVNEHGRVEHSNRLCESNKDESATAPEYETKSMAEVALGFITVANEAMCRPIRELTQMKGHDITKHMLACFGGAGGQHACAIARNLGMTSVFVHRYSGILSAYGMGLADVVEERQEPSAQVLGK